MTAPIVLFVYKRLELTRRTVDALAANRLAAPSQLIVFSDGPKTEADAAPVQAVREYVEQARGFGSLRMVIAPRNKGLARSVIEGVSAITEEFGRGIFIEDDIETSPHFLAYMNDALDRYAQTPQVAAISGYVPPMDTELPETFFQRDAECWGWGTWKRAWSIFEPDGRVLLDRLKRARLESFFDQNGSYPYIRMLKAQIQGKNSSWAVRWRASVILHDMLSLYPRHSLVRNIGFDGSGTHSRTADFMGEMSSTPIRVEDAPLVHSSQAFEAYKRFNRRHFHKPLLHRVKQRLSGLLR